MAVRVAGSVVRRAAAGACIVDAATTPAIEVPAACAAAIRTTTSALVCGSARWSPLLVRGTTACLGTARRQERVEVRIRAIEHMRPDLKTRIWKQG